MTVLSPSSRVHIMGVAGAGMSALAVYLAEWGAAVSGCDERPGPVLDQLAHRGVRVREGHDASHLENVDVLLWSPAVREDHPELLAGRASGCRLLSRRELLADLARTRSVLAVTGTHGKTTATSMLAHVLAAAGDASWIVGAEVRDLGYAGHFGSGPLALELDESYGTFTEISPAGLAVLNVDVDHLDYYGDLDSLRRAFAEVMERTSGPVVIYEPDVGATTAAALARREIVRVGPSRSGADFELDLLEHRPFAIRGLLRSGGDEVELNLRVGGEHNLVDAALVAALARSVGVSSEAVSEGVGAFRGAPRRFERVGEYRGADVVIDYAHLPAEIAATLRGARESGYRDPVVVFQPHRYSRTLEVGDDFAPAFDDLDLLVVTDIYGAGETNPTGVTGEFLVEALLRRGRVGRVLYARDLAEAAAQLEGLFCGDLLLLVGAGDVPTLATLLGASA